MSNTSPNRRFLTDWMKDLLTTSGLKTDIAVAPLDAGWNDNPRLNGSYFDAYTVILPLASADSEGPLNDMGGIWTLPYSLSSYAISSAAVEDQADTARRIVHEANRSTVDLGGTFWRVMSTMTSSIGGVDINYQVEPPQLMLRDVVSLRITKKET
jgi:hypothetical protein